MHGNKLPGPPPSFPVPPAQAEPMSTAHGRPAGWLGARHNSAGGRFTAHTQHRAQLGIQGSRGLAEHQAGDRLTPRFPAKGTEGAKGTAHLLGTPYRYRVPISANQVQVLAWPSMHGILVPWAVLQVWRESDDVLPSRVHSCSTMAQGTAHNMHACNASSASSKWLACLQLPHSLSRPLSRLYVSPLYLAHVRVPLSRFPVINDQPINHSAGPS